MLLLLLYRRTIERAKEAIDTKRRWMMVGGAYGARVVASCDDRQNITDFDGLWRAQCAGAP